VATQRQIDIIVIHESASPRRGDGAADINDWHLENDWSGIGYHYVIDDNGEVEAGRPEYWTGAHVKGYNTNSLGICMTGKNGNFTSAQWDMLHRLCIELKRRYAGVTFYGHRDLDERKSCPGFDVRKWCRDIGI